MNEAWQGTVIKHNKLSRTFHLVAKNLADW